MKHTLLLLSLCLCSANFLAGQSNNPINQSPTEDDWSLPAWVTKSTNAGLYDVPSIPDAYSLVVTWRQLNPQENIYDWSAIDNAVALNVPFFIRIWASDTMHCPEWLRIKYPTLPILHYGAPNDTYFDLINTTLLSPGNFYAMWDTSFTTEIEKFLLAFKAQNYLANPNIKFMYAPGAWRWCEWELGPMLSELKIKAPISPANFVIWFKTYVDAYADASNGYAHKMVFTGYGKVEQPVYYGGDMNWFLTLNDTAVGENVLTSYAVSKGMGVREGAQEFFNGSNDAYSWGAPSITINNINYQTVLDNHPLHADTLRITGTENEGFCDPTMLGICSYYHIKMSTLKAMQLRVNWLNSRDGLVAADTSLFEYARRTMNKPVQQAPDAWVALRQVNDCYFTTPSTVPVFNSPLWVNRVTLPYRNWEKWLTQRAVSPDGNVVPVYQLNSLHLFDVYNFKAFEALRTDRANGSDYMYFNVDSNFIYGGTTDVQLKITYLDNFSGNWWVEYDASSSQIYKQSTLITNANDNNWKTVTISIPDAGFANRQNGGMDFRLYTGGSHDLTVRFVRVIKNNDPLLAVTQSAPVNDFGVSIYPNPATSTLSINSSTPIDAIRITTMLGQTVLESTVTGLPLDISTLDSGMYFVTVFSDRKSVTKKVVVNR